MNNGKVAKLRDRSGQSLAELVLMSPVLLILAFGIIEFGMAFQTHQAVTNVAREGARVSSLTDASDEGVREAVANRLRASGLDPDQAEIMLACDGEEGGLCTGPDRSGRSSWVSIAYPYEFFMMGGLSRLIGGDGEEFGVVAISARTIMVNE